jgi:hypothetical protein
MSVITTIGTAATSSGEPTQHARVRITAIGNSAARYPTILTTGDERTIGSGTIAFDDTSTILFESGKAVSYPNLLPIGSSIVSQSIASPNKYPDITVSSANILASTVNPTSGVLDSAMTYNAFDESRIYLQSTGDFYLTGTDPTVLEGFSGPLSSRAVIKIDLTTTSEKKITRYSSDFDSLDPSGEFAGQNKTGFCYYNFSTSTWEDIGLKDPLTGIDVLYDYRVDAIGAGTTLKTVTSGTDNFPRQFYPGSAERETNAGAASAKFIGLPSISNFAPNSARYHATSSQVLRMSEYISEPFLLEKAILKIPVNGRRIQDSYLNSQNARRPQDDYVFFIYRQISGAGIKAYDSDQDVSGSIRTLIASASINFYNNKYYDGSSSITGFEPSNSPAFSQDLDVPISSTRQVGSFTGSIVVPFSPGVASKNMQGTYRINAGSGKAAKIDSYWPGGATTLPLEGSWKGGSSSSDPRRKILNFDSSNSNQTYSQINLLSAQETMNELPIEFQDPRASKLFGGSFRNRFAGSGVSSLENSVLQSPYILNPSDRLVFGFDAALNHTAVQAANSQNEVTGSMLTIRAEEASLLLYGSLVREKVRLPHSLNQNLTSYNVHHDIGSELITDQNETEDLAEYRQSLDGDFISGDFYSNDPTLTRKVRKSAYAGTLGTSGSLNRNVTIQDNQEIYLDSIPPDIFDYLSPVASNLNLTLKQNDGAFNQAIRLSSPTAQTDFGDSRKFPYPYVSDPKRNKANRAAIINSAGLPAVINEFDVKTLVFGFGYDISGVSSRGASDTIKGASGFKYGILNVRDTPTKVVWKRNHYGYFRDIMEQRRDSRFYKSGEEASSPIVCTFVSYDDKTTPVSAESTISSNLSSFATSSLPYFDGEFKNRDSAISESTEFFTFS